MFLCCSVVKSRCLELQKLEIESEAKNLNSGLRFARAHPRS